MLNHFGCGLNFIWITLLIFVCTSRTQEVLKNGSTITYINYGIKDDFRAEIPDPFKQIGSKYYHISEIDSGNWFGAVEYCRRNGGHLLNLQNESELKNVEHNLSSSYDFWTDMNNLVNETVFHSLTTGSTAEFFNNENNANKPNMCGILQYDNDRKNFTLRKNHCVKAKGRAICETTLPLTISIVVW